MDIAIEVIGWTGAVLVLAAYIGVSTGRISGTSILFQWLNASGAALFVVNTWWHGAFPSMVLNIIWSIVGFVTLIRINKAKCRS